MDSAQLSLPLLVVLTWLLPLLGLVNPISKQDVDRVFDKPNDWREWLSTKEIKVAWFDIYIEILGIVLANWPAGSLLTWHWGGAIEWVIDVMVAITNTVVPPVLNLANRVAASLNSAWTWISELGDDVRNILTWITNAPAYVWQWIQNFWNANIQPLKDWVWQTIQAVWNGLWDNLSPIREWWNNLSNEVNLFLSDPASYLYNTITEPLQGWVGERLSFLQPAKDWVDTFGEQLQAFANDPVNYVLSRIEDAVEEQSHRLLEVGRRILLKVWWG